MAWDINELRYVRSGYAGTYHCEGIAFNDDGTKFYIVENNTSEGIYQISQYSIPEAWTLNNRSLEKSNDLQYNFGHTNPTSITWEFGGRDCCVSLGGGTLVKYFADPYYDVGGLYDPQTGSSNNSNPTGIAFGENGNKMYDTDETNGAITEYELGTTYDPSTINSTKVTSSQGSSPQGITFNDTGYKMYTVDSSTGYLYEYDLSTNYDIASSSLSKSKDIESYYGGNLSDLTWGRNGTRLYITSNEYGDIFEFHIAHKVSTNSVDNISSDSADANGDIDDTGGEDTCDERGFVFSTTSYGDPGDTSPSNSNYENSIKETGNFGTGSFSLKLDNLSSNTTYYVRAYAHNDAGYVYGSETSFTTAQLISQTINSDAYIKGPESKTTTIKSNYFIKKTCPDYFVLDLDNDSTTLSEGTLTDVHVNTYNKVKNLEVSDSGGVSVSKAVPLKITSGDDSTTGTGDIVLDWTNIADKQDIAVSDENDNLLDYYFESFDATSETAVIWVYRDWVRDGSTQLKVYYGSNSDNTDYSVTASTVFSKESNLEIGFLLDESSGDATDISGNSNTGTYYGDLPTPTPMLLGDGQDFDGTGDYVDIADINFTSIAVVTWVNFDTVSAQQVIATDRNDNTGGGWTYIFRIESDGTLNIYIKDGNDDTYSITSSSSLSAGTNYRVGFSYDGTTLRLYIDGTEDGSVTVGTTGIDNKTGNSKIGTTIDNNGNTGYYLDGQVDDYRLWGANISSDDFAADYAATKSSPDFFSQQASQTTNTVPKKASGLVLANKPVLQFDGSDDYVALDKYYDTQGVFGDLTVEAWVKIPTDGGDWAVLDFDRSEYYTCAPGIPSGSANGTGDYVGFHTTDSGSTTSNMWSNGTVRDDTWRHIAWVFDSASGNKYIYIDGVEDSSQSISDIGSGTTRYGIIGDGSEAGSYDGQRNNNYFKGSIQEITIWDGVSRSQEDINNDMYKIYDSSYSLTNYYKFDDGSGSTLTDSSGSADGGITSATWTTTSQFYIESGTRETPELDLSKGVVCTDSNIEWFGGRELYLDGDYVAIENYNYSSSFSQLTVEVTFRTRADNNFILASFDRNEYWRLEIGNAGGGSDGKVGMSFNTDTEQVDGFNSSSIVSDGEWHTVSFVYDNGNAYLYLDGVLENSTTSGSSMGSGTTRYGFLGANSEANSPTDGPATIVSNGWLSDFRLWETARTEEEIKAYKDKELYGTEPNLAIYYDFSECEGDTLYDRSSNSNNGIINGGTWPLQVETNVSFDGGSTWEGWTLTSNKSSIPNLGDISTGKAVDIRNAKLKTRQTLRTNDRSYSPSLNSLSVEVSGSPSLFSDTKVKQNYQETITSDSYISKERDVTLTSTAYIKTTYDETIQSDTNISVEEQYDLLSDYSVKTSYSETRSSDYYIQKSYDELISSDSFLEVPYEYTQASDYFIKNTYDSTILSDAYLNYKFAGTITSDYTLLSENTGEIQSEAFVVGDKQGFLLGEHYIKASYKKDIRSRAYILFPWLRSDISIKKTKSSIRNSRSWIIIARDNSITSDYYIKKLDKQQTISSGAWVSVEKTDTIISDYHLLSPEPQTIESSYLLKSSFTEVISSDIHLSEIKQDTISSISSIIEPKQETITSDYNIFNTYSNTLKSDSSLIEIDREFISSNSSIKTDYKQTISSDTNIIIPVLKTIQSNAELNEPTLKTITSDYLISVGKRNRIDSNAEINTPTLKTITSDAYISKVKENNINAIYHIRKIEQKSLSSVAVLVEKAQRYLSSRHHIKSISEQDITSDYYLSLLTTTQIESGSYIVECGDWSETWKLQLRYTFQENIQCDYTITAEGTKPEVYDASYVNKPEVYYATNDKPEIVDGGYVNKPQIYGGTTG